ncbi:MAG: BBP7 family outer membrane beta-barrel protein [Planctomycetaceae bacterium]|nr:BBP7 family outer membrane beta-barrel protein [Planctomycetaceae bacterium]
MMRWTQVVLIALASWTTTVALAQGPYVPSGYGAPQPGPPDPSMWHNYGQWSPQQGGYYQGPQTTRELIPDHADQWSGLDRSPHNFREAFHGAWIHADYLLWDIQGPGDTLIGAPMASTDPRSAFSAFDPIGGARLDDQGLPIAAIDANFGGTYLRNSNSLIVGIPNDNRAAFQLANGASHDNLNGARLSGGIPLYDGVLEAEVWALQDSGNPISFPSYTVTTNATTLIPAITLLEDGLPSDTAMILFSEGMTVQLNANMWGTEGNWVFRPSTPANHHHLQIFPMLGFRYMRMQEEMLIAGADIADPVNLPNTVLNHRINSVMGNRLFGPQAGLRFLLESRFLTLGFEPKVALTVNRVNQDVSTQEIYNTTSGGFDINGNATPAEAPRSETDQFTRFSPTLDLSCYAKWNITENFSVNVGYDFMLTGSVYRAYDNVAYESADPTGAPAIGIDRSRSSMYVHGLMIGGQWLLP